MHQINYHRISRSIIAMPRAVCKKIYLRPVAYIILFLTLGATMVALGTSDWYYVDVHGNRTYSGIWNVCQGSPDALGHCSFLPDSREDIDRDAMTGVRGLYAMAVMLLFGALGYPPFYRQMSTGILKIEFMAMLAAGAGLCSSVAMLIMTHGIYKRIGQASAGYSYYTGWAATGLAFFSAGLIFLASKDNSYIEKALT